MCIDALRSIQSGRGTGSPPLRRPIPVEVVIISERRVKLFKIGGNQTIRIPRDFEMPGEIATMRKEGRRLILEPVAIDSLLTLLATLDPIVDEFPPIGELTLDPVEL